MQYHYHLLECAVNDKVGILATLRDTKSFSVAKLLFSLAKLLLAVTIQLLWKYEKNADHQIHSCFRSARTSCATFDGLICLQAKQFLFPFALFSIFGQPCHPCQPRQPGHPPHFWSLLVTSGHIWSFCWFLVLYRTFWNFFLIFWLFLLISSNFWYFLVHSGTF